MKEAFKEQRFSRASMSVIEHANLIINQHKAEDSVVTLRQLYYCLVQRSLIANKVSEYKRVASIISDARVAGLIDWNAIEDRVRLLREIPTYATPNSFVRSQVDQYAEHIWYNQPVYCEVWIEKEALVGVIERSCVRYRVPFFACRGFASQSSLYEAGARLKAKIDEGREVVIFHLGDHDPTGLDMTRDNDERTNMFARTLAGVRVNRIGLNMDQIERFNLPPDPMKIVDSRASDYTDRYGDCSWELDALPSNEIERLVVSSIEGVINKASFDKALTAEAEARTQLMLISKHWGDALDVSKAAQQAQP